MDTKLLIFLFIALMGFVYLESVLFFRIIKFLVNKLVLIKTFAAGLPIEMNQPEDDKPCVPNYPDDDFGPGTIEDTLPPEAQDEEFKEELKTGDELEEVGI